MKDFARGLSQRAKDDPGVKVYKSMGTPIMVDIMSRVGSFPTRYSQKSIAEHREQDQRCCPPRTLRRHSSRLPQMLHSLRAASTVKEGRHKGLKIEGPEDQTIYAFGGLCEVDSIEEIAYLNDICDRLGMDTISAGNLAALTIEAVRQGKIDYPIDYGQVDNVAALLNDIAYRRGIGNTLADGIKPAAEAMGMADQAIHVKGLEPAGYDPRVLKGTGWLYGTSDRGACHLGPLLQTRACKDDRSGPDTG